MMNTAPSNPTARANGRLLAISYGYTLVLQSILTSSGFTNPTITQLKIADPSPNPDMQMPEHNPLFLGRCRQQFLSGGKQPIPMENPQQNPQKITNPTKLFINDAANTEVLMAITAAIHKIRLDILLRNMVQMATPTLMVMIVKVNSIDIAVLDVLSFWQYRYEDMYGVNAPNVYIEPNTIRVSVLEHRAIIDYLLMLFISASG